MWLVDIMGEQRQTQLFTSCHSLTLWIGTHFLQLVDVVQSKKIVPAENMVCVI